MTERKGESDLDRASDPYRLVELALGEAREEAISGLFRAFSVTSDFTGMRLFLKRGRYQ